MIQRYNTLRVRFAFWIAGLLFAILLIFGIFVYTSMAGGLAASVDASLQLSAVQAIAAAVDNGRISIADGIPEPSAITALDDRGFTIRILRLDGTVQGAFGLYRTLPASDSDIAAALEKNEQFSTVIEPSQQEPVRFFTAPIIEDNQVLAIIQVAQSLDPVYDTMEQLLTILLVIIPLLVALTSVGGYVLAARALAPVDAITQTAQRISAHDLHERLNLPSTKDEVGRLATTFDMMLGRLEASFQRERQFTADASHELRTPLTAMQTIIAVTRECPRSPEEYEQVLDDFSCTTGRLRHLVEDLLQLARRDTSTQIVFKRVDLSTLLQDVNAVIEPLVEAKHLKLVSAISDHLELMGDSDDLVRLFMNLLDNAVKYTDGGEIKIQATAVNDQIEVIITDTGVGIGQEELPRVFDRFYRVDSSRSTQGSGLGLAIAHSIAQAHQGAITISSQPGRSTAVTVILPIVSVDI